MVGWVVLETTAALVALLAALLVVGRYRSSSTVRDFALVHAFVVLAVANLLPNVLPVLMDGTIADPHLRLRLRLVTGLLAAASFALAALADHLRWATGRTPPVVAVAAGLVTPALGTLLLGAIRIGPTDTTAVRVLAGAAGVLLALAALGFHTQRRAVPDQFRSHLAVGVLLAATARFAIVLSPTPFAAVADRAHVSDVFRLGFYAFVLLAAVEEIRSYWSRLAVEEERRRLARDLHDGVAQELAYIAAEARRHPSTRSIDGIAAAAARALDESRRAISALTQPLDQPLDEAVAQAAEEVAARNGVSLRFELTTGITVDPPVHQECVRIVREAVGNAARHAHADAITVVLARGARNDVRLRVIDDGAGFVPRSKPGRLGLTSMKERAAAIGGDLSIWSAVGDGTVVELALPLPA
jgi:signal transduction histidine kinase